MIVSIKPVYLFINSTPYYNYASEYTTSKLRIIWCYMNF